MTVESLPVRRTTSFDRLESILSTAGENDDVLLAQVAVMPEFAAEVLRTANSEAWGRGMKIDRLDHAVILLGPKGIAAVAEELARRPEFDRPENHLTRSFAEHSIAVSLAAEMVAQASELQIGPAARTAGLVHDVGFLILAETRGDELAAAIGQSKANGSRVIEHERLILGTDHCEVGEAWMQANGFPASLISATAYHHDPMIAPPEHRYLTMLVYAAECAARHGGYSELDGEMAPALEDRVLEELRLTPRIVESYSKTLRDRVRREIAERSDRG